MQVWDTSAFITAWNVHYRPTTFAPLWERIAEHMEAGSIVAPREVYNELQEKDDGVAEWARDHRDDFTDPPLEVQRAIGPIMRDHYSVSTIRDKADPWVVTEAHVRGFTAVTYEGVDVMTNEPTKKFDSKMPGICKRLGVPCCVVPEALERLGVRLG